MLTGVEKVAESEYFCVDGIKNKSPRASILESTGLDYRHNTSGPFPSPRRARTLSLATNAHSMTKVLLRMVVRWLVEFGVLEKSE
jgi:hypothetical protein